jgi:hypothetical protein
MGFWEVRGCGREPFTQLREIPLPFHWRTHGTVPLRVRLRHAPTSGSVFESRAGHGVQAEGACNWLRPVCVSVARVSGGTWVRSDCFVSKSSSALKPAPLVSACARPRTTMEIAGKRRRAVAQARAEQQAHDHAQPAFDLAALAAARAVLDRIALGRCAAFRAPDTVKDGISDPPK